LLIKVVENPFKGVESALVIAGSDKWETYYALLDVSLGMGVSPWYWWADVPVDKHENVLLKTDTLIWADKVLEDLFK
jgi:hypothetical protein